MYGQGLARSPYFLLRYRSRTGSFSPTYGKPRAEGRNNNLASQEQRFTAAHSRRKLPRGRVVTETGQPRGPFHVIRTGNYVAVDKPARPRAIEPRKAIRHHVAPANRVPMIAELPIAHDTPHCPSGSSPPKQTLIVLFSKPLMEGIGIGDVLVPKKHDRRNKRG
jgi:hypothetical protein